MHTIFKSQYPVYRRNQLNVIYMEVDTYDLLLAGEKIATLVYQFRGARPTPNKTSLWYLFYKQLRNSLTIAWL